VALPVTRTPTGTGVASLLAIGGVFVDRMTFVAAGQIAPTSVAGNVAAPFAAYSPSPVEIAIILGAVAFVALVYTLAERYLDLNESDVHAAVTLPVPSLAKLRALLSPRRRTATEGAAVTEGSVVSSAVSSVVSSAVSAAVSAAPAPAPSAKAGAR
jgi:hypothetical protein